jgi:D-tyrosyl-tRNA(Tyr) deacylase
MRAVIQRVTRAAVEVDGDVIARIDGGLLVLLGVAKDDTEIDAHYVADKLFAIRIFRDAEGKMNRSIVDAGGQLLIVSQFTLLGDMTKGRRPSFDRAASPEQARMLYEQVVAMVRRRGIHVETGRFGADMHVALDNDGPVTFLLESRSADLRARDQDSRNESEEEQWKGNEKA